MTPLKSSPSPMGMLTAPTRLPKASSSPSSELWKSASLRSMWLMKMERQMRMFSAVCQSLVVITCTPVAASITKSAISAACMEAMVSPRKSGYPEVSRMLIL